MNKFTLNQIKAGESFILVKLVPEIKTELIRLGLCEGMELRCVAKIPAGPVVVMKDLHEIAIGNKFAREIEVQKI